MKVWPLLLGLSLLAAYAAADELLDAESELAVATVRVINNAQRSYGRAYPEAGYACDLAKFAVPRDGIPSQEHAGMLEDWVIHGGRNGYSYIVFCGDLTKPQKTYRTAAIPDHKGAAFCSDESGVIRSSDDGKPGSCFSHGKAVPQGGK